MPAARGEEYTRDIRTGQSRYKHRQNIADALKTHGKEVTKELKKVTSTGPRSGRMYLYRGRMYRASAKGEPPAKRSGRLSNGFEYKSNQMQLIIGNTAFSKRGFPYPRHLEENMNRPFFINTIERLHSRLQADLQNFI